MFADKKISFLLNRSNENVPKSCSPKPKSSIYRSEDKTKETEPVGEQT